METKSPNTVWVASFDIGKKNFCWCIEEFEKEKLKHIQDIEKEKRFNRDGTATESMKKILTQIYLTGRIISHLNTDLTKDCKNETTLEIKIFSNMFELLERNLHLWEQCDFILIEEQMHFGTKTNFMAVKLAQHCYSYFVFKFRTSKPIIDFPSYHKTQILGAYKIEGKKYKSGLPRYKAMEKPARKKWAVDKANEILSLRNEKCDFNTSKAKKKDDLADTFLMIQAFKYLHFVES